MSQGPSAEQVLGRVTLVTGKEEFLAERTVAQCVSAVRAFDAMSEVTETSGGAVTAAVLAELASPSLFSEIRCVVIKALEDVPSEHAAALLEFAASPPPEVALVAVYRSGPKGSGTLNKLRKLPLTTEIKAEEIKAWHLPQFVLNEARQRGLRMDPEAASDLVGAVGTDLRSLSAAVSQLGTDLGGVPLTREGVARYFGGRPDAKAYLVADAVLSGNESTGLEELRWALELSVGGPAITASLASSLRGLIGVATAGPRARDADVAAVAKVPPWKVKTLRAQARGWSEEALGAAMQAVAVADAEVKGLARAPEYTLERLVLTLCGLRRHGVQKPPRMA